jgi:hypothetical protein
MNTSLFSIHSQTNLLVYIALFRSKLEYRSVPRTEDPRPQVCGVTTPTASLVVVPFVIQ